MSVLNVKDFWDQLLLSIQQKLSDFVFGNKWWEHLTDAIGSFAVNYNTQCNLDRQVMQKALE